jgi:hypothetical protein
VYVRGGNILPEGGDVLANFAGSSRDAYLDETDFAGERGETLGGVEIYDDLAVLGVATGVGNCVEWRRQNSALIDRYVRRVCLQLRRLPAERN